MFVGLLWCIEHFDKGFMWNHLFFLPKLYYVCDIIIFISTVKKMREFKWLAQSLAASQVVKQGVRLWGLIAGPEFWVTTLAILDDFIIAKSLVSISVSFHVQHY